MVSKSFNHISILICFLVSFVFSGTEGQIRGRIMNVEGEPLIGAQIFIEKLGIGAVADTDGNYILINVPVGTYDVQASMISYSTAIVAGVHVIMDNTVWLNFSMEVEAIEGEIIRVSAEKALVDKGATSKKVTIGQEDRKSVV